MAKVQYGFLRVRKGDIVVDVGAYPGDFTLHSSLLVGDTGKVIAIEPHPRNFAFLKANVVLNNLRNVILINKAVSNYVGKGQLNGIDTGAHLSRLKGIPVEVVTLDKLLYDLGITRVDVVKIDIEGQEKEALEGFQLITGVREIAIETHTKYYLNYVTKYLMERGFKVRFLDNLLLIRNVLKDSVIPCLFLAEFKSRFLASRLLLRYMLGTSDHPIPACRSRATTIVYGIRY
jgi:FkbM family methyltransferase